MSSCTPGATGFIRVGEGFWLIEFGQLVPRHCDALVRIHRDPFDPGPLCVRSGDDVYDPDLCYRILGDAKRALASQLRHQIAQAKRWEEQLAALNPDLVIEQG